MKKSVANRFLGILTAFAVIFSLIVLRVSASGTVRYTRLTQAPRDWTGEYLLVYEGDGLAFNSGLTDPDSANNYAAVTIADNAIQVSDRSMSVFVEAVEGGYVMKTSRGVYIYCSSNNNGMSTTYNKSTAAQYPITFTSTQEGVDIALSVGVHMRFNNTPSQMRFRYYKSGTYTNQQPVTLYKLESTLENNVESSEFLRSGQQVMIYNAAAQSVLSFPEDSTDRQTISGVSASFSDGIVQSENGALVFTVERNGNYYRFRNETYGYLSSGSTGNNAYYCVNGGEEADWVLEELGNGFSIKSRAAVYNGTTAQYLEYYSNSYKTYSFNSSGADAYTFQFCPCGNFATEGIVNEPKAVFGDLKDATLGAAYELTFDLSVPFGVESLSVAVNGSVVEADVSEDMCTVNIPAQLVIGECLTIQVSGVDKKGVAISGSTSVPVRNVPAVVSVSPGNGEETGSNLRPVIWATVVNAGENPTITMSVNGQPVDAAWKDGKITYTPTADLSEGRTSVTVTLTRSDGKTASKTWGFIVGKSAYQLYFGQLHSHTTYSDGSGSLDLALEYIADLPDSANVDFVAFTDHSNYFDTSADANPESALYDMAQATAYSQNLWSAYKSDIAQFNATHSDILAIGGFEMTWSGGPGHMNTFNTSGVVSRNNTTLNNKTNDAGLLAYYALLSQAEGSGSISQFNHPGTAYGTFSDFAYRDQTIDSRIYLIEVGNGDGAIGASGYYTSYEYYTMALDLGWHVAPTNNQDNHKGNWGNANDARDAIFAQELTEEGIYEAIQALRVYATEDKNLEIYYTVNDQMMGSAIADVSQPLDICVQVSDPDESDIISKVEVIVNGGKTAYTWQDPSQLALGELTAWLDPEYSYYYVRVTQKDGDIAVTAPVWVSKDLDWGISDVEADKLPPTVGEEMTLTVTLFNGENADASILSMTGTYGSQVLFNRSDCGTIPASGTAAVFFPYTPTEARTMTITVTAVVQLDGRKYTFTMDTVLDVQKADPSITVEQFTDLEIGSWYYDSIDYMVRVGLMNGMSENTFQPNGTLTRGQMVTILYRMAGQPSVSGSVPFVDVVSGSYYADAVLWGYQSGVVKGITETGFAPNQQVTREQLATFLYRYDGSPSSASETLAGFADRDQVSSYARSAMSWALEQGIVKGTSNTTLAPKNLTTRAQAATMAARYLQ